MSLKGRKRQTGPREPSGRPARSSSFVAQDYAPAAVKRLTDCAIRGMADAVYGTPLGLLYLAGKLSPAQFEAGRRWDRLARHYRSAIRAPRRDPQTLALDLTARGAAADPESREGQTEVARDAATVAAMGAARAVLAAAGKQAEAAVQAFCEAQELPVGWHGETALIAGLEALAVHWRLTRARRR